jgi:hypothetical protein
MTASTADDHSAPSITMAPNAFVPVASPEHLLDAAVLDHAARRSSDLRTGDRIRIGESTATRLAVCGWPARLRAAVLPHVGCVQPTVPRGFIADCGAARRPGIRVRPLRPGQGPLPWTFYLPLTHHQIEATLPLRPHAEVRNGSYWVTLDSVLTSSGRMELRLQESDATSSFDRRPRAERTYYLRNRRNGTALEARPSDSDTGPQILGGVTVSRAMSGFWAAGIALRFPPPWVGRDFNGLDETSLQDADLVIVRSTREGAVERTLDIDRFSLDATASAETRLEP